MTITELEPCYRAQRIVRFGETDAAGVIHFHHLLRWCHEAWEESLENFGLDSSEVFPKLISDDDLIDIFLPIIHCEAEYLKPIESGDKLILNLIPNKIDQSCFEVKTRFHREEELMAIGIIKHVAIQKNSRKRCKLPPKIEQWLESSSLC